MLIDFYEQKSTRKFENFHGQLLTDAPKNFYFSKNYDTKIDNTINRVSDGELWLLNLFEDNNIPLRNASIEKLKKMNVVKTRKRNYSRTPERLERKRLTYNEPFTVNSESKKRESEVQT
jgi:hypothetical protein